MEIQFLKGCGLCTVKAKITALTVSGKYLPENELSLSASNTSFALIEITHLSII